MKILLTTLNAKYVHSSLALRYLKNYSSQSFSDITLKEYTINDSLDYITSEIYQEKAEVVAFSCYIWNISQTLKIIDNLKKVAPETVIVLGGPEVSYDPEEILKQNSRVDYIISGEGEYSFNQLLEYLLTKNVELADIPGLSYRVDNNDIKNNEIKLIKNLDILPSPYEKEEDLTGLENKIIYYESSRGCPFNCQYCLSSTIHGVRFFPMEKVKRDLLKLIKIGVKQVKFVDRTFNCNKAHALELMNFLKVEGAGVNFHFEIAADLLDDEIIDFIRSVPTGQFQFEIGIQSTNEKTISKIERKMNLEKVYRTITELREINNTHLHLDLIAGLPYEDIQSFRVSFDTVFNLSPHQLQLGFLKLLKGSGIREKAEEYEYIYQEYPPYQVLGNKWISYSELIKLHNIEELVEKYNNSGAFTNSLGLILNKVWESPFDFFEDFTDFWQDKGLFKSPHSQQGLYSIFADYYKTRQFPYLEEFLEILKFDLLLENRTLNLPSWVKNSEINDIKDAVWDFIKEESNVVKLMPHYQGKKPKDIIKSIHYGNFKVDIQSLIDSNYEKVMPKNTNIIFDYLFKDKVSGHCKYYQI